MVGIGNQRGSLTVEAAIAVPVFICVVLSLAFIMQVVYLQNLVQHAMNESANEMAAYSYFYYKSGVMELHDKTASRLQENSQTAEEQWTKIFEGLNILRSSNNFTGGKGQEEGLQSIPVVMGDENEKAKDAGVQWEEILDHPDQALLGLVAVMENEAFNESKSIAVAPLVRALMAGQLKTSYTDADQRLKGLHVVHGLEGLDVSQTQIFQDGRTIELTVRYCVKPVFPIRILPDLLIIQRAVAAGWLEGTSAYKSEKDTVKEEAGIWDMLPMKRGVKIQELYDRNLPANFPVIARFDKARGEIVSIKSLNIEDTTYQKAANVRSKVKGFIQELCDFKGASFDGVEIKEQEIKKRQLLLIVPEVEISAEVQKVLDDCIRYAKEEGCVMTVQKAFGRASPPAVKENGKSE